MLRLLVATNNPHKLRELQTLLHLPDIEFVSPAEAGVSDEFDVEETGETFAENAKLKAVAFSKQTSLPAVADDSGLMVEALGGEPGVKSKRWIPGTDHDRNQYMLEKLQGETNRNAQFVTVLALYFPENNTTHIFEGTVDGVIAKEERGSDGFGYDPLFVPNGYSGTFAELGDKIKSQLSHRFRAVEKLNTFLATYKE